MLRGEELRRHLLWQAKNVFLDLGFERASMDAIAGRAGTTKRTLYAHFDSKERLFLAVVDLVRGLLEAKIGLPDDLADDSTEALSLFCNRVRASVLWGPTIRTCRLGIGEAARFPEGAAGFYEALFGATIKHAADYVHHRFDMPAAPSRTVAGELVSLALEPSFTRALFGVDDVPEDWREPSATHRAVGCDIVRRVLQSRGMTDETASP